MATTMRRSSRLSSRPDNAPSSVVMPSSAPRSRKRKTQTDDALETPATATEPPTTPQKRSQARPPMPPVTPTPSLAGVLTQSRSPPVKKPRNAAINRLADPQLSNATLLSPESSRLVASRDVENLSPSKPPQHTTANLLQEACDYLIKVDKRMQPLVDKNHCHAFSPEGLAESIDPFESLLSGIISQQVSGAAAKSIKAKFVGLFDIDNDRRFPSPSEVNARSIENLRTAGLSQRKAEYVKGVAEKFVNGELTAQLLHDAPYEELLEKLIAIRGLGKWSVEMFACFALKRMDVFSLGDLGVQRGMAAFVGKDVSKLKAKGGGKFKYMSEKDMIELSDKFAPYRSLFMWYMWRVEETDISTME